MGEYQPDVLVDASGPFQEYRDHKYLVVEACIRQGVHYLDLADAPGFVADIVELDKAARRAGIFVLSGVSSFPVLTAAVLHKFGQDRILTRVVAGIAPSPFAGVGLSVMRAVLGYAGGPIMLRRDGRWHTAYGFTESIRYTIAPPGSLPLRNLRFSLVDVPDYKVIPREISSIDEMWIGAATVPEALHRLLNGLATLRRRFRLPSLGPVARLCHWVVNHVRYGAHRGGMFVEVTGRQAGTEETYTWHLLAEGDDGLYIPSMPAAILLRKFANGEPPAPGARPAVAELTLEDYDRAFAKRRIFTGVRAHSKDRENPFRRILGDRLAGLPESIRELLAAGPASRWTGTAAIETAANSVARLAARMLGLPVRTDLVNVAVCLHWIAGNGNWEVEIGSAVFRGTYDAGTGPDEQLLCVRCGSTVAANALVIGGARLHFVPRRWRIGHLRFPAFLTPDGDNYVFDADGQPGVDVRLELPLIGFVARYRCTLTRKG